MRLSIIIASSSAALADEEETSSATAVKADVSVKGTLIDRERWPCRQSIVGAASTPLADATSLSKCLAGIASTSLVDRLTGLFWSCRRNGGELAPPSGGGRILSSGPLLN